jgi:hypothetical protein
MKTVEEALTTEVNSSFEREEGFIGGASRGVSGAAFLRTDPCLIIDDASKSVDVIVRVLFLRFDLRSFANNLLTLPRSLEPSFYNKMPAALRLLNPHFDFNYDRRAGPSVALALSTNLLHAPALLNAQEMPEQPTKLELAFVGEKSLDKPFYKSDLKFALTHNRPSQLIEELQLSVALRADEQPLNVTRQTEFGLRAGGELKLRPRTRLVNTMFLSGTYRGRSLKVFTDPNRALISEHENAGMFRGLIDGKLGSGFTRVGVWFDAAKPTTGAGYRRLAAMVGYQNEIGSRTQTLGVEAVLGAGRSWGTAPLYAQFFAGNNLGSFVQESPSSPVLTEFPVGPFLRSYGKTEAGTTRSITGGRSYWHANLNLAFPIQAWSRALIPDEVVTFEGGDIKLNQLLENFTIKTAIGTIADDLLDSIIEELMKSNPAMTEDEAAQQGASLAEERARRIVEKEVGPTIRYIARRANLYAFKPMVMLDGARLNGFSTDVSRMRFGVGGGLQFVLAVAKAEVGYVAALPRIAGEPKGNFVFRMTFQNLY